MLKCRHKSMCCILEQAAQEPLSPYRLMDKPIGYEPIIRGSNPRGETILYSKGSVIMLLPKIIDWVSLEVLEDKQKIYERVCEASPFSKESIKYADIAPYGKEAELDELHEDALIKELVKNKYVICGDTHQHKAIPIFSDGYLLLSMRRWSKIMEDAYVHIDVLNSARDPWFYMATTCSVKENIPNE